MGFPVEFLVFTEDKAEKLKNVKTSLISTNIEKGSGLNGGKHQKYIAKLNKKSCR
jgi:hypothetical protein